MKASYFVSSLWLCACAFRGYSWFQWSLMQLYMKGHTMLCYQIFWTSQFRLLGMAPNILNVAQFSNIFFVIAKIVYKVTRESKPSVHCRLKEDRISNGPGGRRSGERNLAPPEMRRNQHVFKQPEQAKCLNLWRWRWTGIVVHFWGSRWLLVAHSHKYVTFFLQTLQQ
jgi:hypothetical protein